VFPEGFVVMNGWASKPPLVTSVVASATGSEAARKQMAMTARFRGANIAKPLLRTGLGLSLDNLHADPMETTKIRKK
jgi:hypothetical protein